MAQLNSTTFIHICFENFTLPTLPAHTKTREVEDSKTCVCTNF